MRVCTNCGNILPQPKPKPIHIYHYVNGVQHTNLAVPYSDAFYEITDGKWKGNLVHIFNMERV